MNRGQTPGMTSTDIIAAPCFMSQESHGEPYVNEAKMAEPEHLVDIR